MVSCHYHHLALDTKVIRYAFYMICIQFHSSH